MELNTGCFTFFKFTRIHTLLGGVEMDVDYKLAYTSGDWVVNRGMSYS